MTDPVMDVPTALSTLDKALAYTQPLRRRIEGVTWVLFGLASALFVTSYGWIWELGLDPAYRLILLWLVGYALLALGPGLLLWRIASLVDEDARIEPPRVAATVAILAALLLALNYSLWGVFGETRFSVALNIAAFGSAAWLGLATAQWSRLSAKGRRDTWRIAVADLLLSFVLVYALRAGAGTVALDILIFLLATSLLPTVAGVWRIARE